MKALPVAAALVALGTTAQAAVVSIASYNIDDTYPSGFGG